MPEPVENQYFLIGHIARLHGVDGTVLIIPVPEAETPALFDDIELLRLQNERGDLIPARIASVRFQQKDDRLSFFVKFEHIANRNEAEAVNGFPVLAAKNKISHLIPENDNYISFEVFDNKKDRIGVVEDTIENPAHSILEVSTESEELLIPFVDEYIQEVDEENSVIYCRNLDRLKALKDDAN